MDFGAVADGKTDSTGAINQAIQTAKQLRSAVYVPKGTFIHGSFVLDGVSMFGAGPESVLWARSAEASNIYLRGTAPSLRALSVRITSSGRDVRNFAVYVDGATGFVVDRVHIDGGNAGGILNFGGTDGRITDNQISNTLADAIHNTNGARHILIAGNVVRRAGDDMIAVVSYRMQPISRDILIENNDLQDQAFGRGIAVVGGLLFSQALTLYTTPVVYLAFEHLRQRVGRWWKYARTLATARWNAHCRKSGECDRKHPVRN